MPFGARRRFVTNASLVLLLLILGRILEASFGNRALTASIAIIVVASLQTLAFAEAGAWHHVRLTKRLVRIHSTRAVGFSFTLLVVCISYALQHKFILDDWHVGSNLPWLVLPLCFSVAIDGMSSRPYVDEYWTLGRVLRSARWTATPAVKRDFGSGFIKAFFYPLMFVLIEFFLDRFRSSWSPGSWAAADIYHTLLLYCFFIDLVFAAAGYALSLKILGNRVHSVNPYPWGWLATIVCYSPFWDLLGRIVIFEWKSDWLALTGDRPVVQFIWLAMIACCLVIYAWSTVELGIRFSNLTYRGLVDSGPYRLLKHPAYVSKLLSIWLIAVPFAGLHGWTQATQQSLILLFYCCIYFARAKYEEKHLRHYPEYRAYASRSPW